MQSVVPETCRSYLRCQWEVSPRCILAERTTCAALLETVVRRRSEYRLPNFHLNQDQASSVEWWQESKVEGITKRCGGLGVPRDVLTGSYQIDRI